MLDKLRAVESRYEELCARSEQPEFYNDPKKAAAQLREKTELEPIVEAFQAYNRAQQEMADAQELMSDPEMKELCQETFTRPRQTASGCTVSFSFCCCPKTPTTKKASLWRSGAA